MADDDQQLKSYSAVARLMALVSHLSESQLIGLLKQTIGDGFTHFLFKLALELSDDQQRTLLKKIEGMVLENGEIDKRGYPRKPCLVNVAYTVQNRNYRGFILDISGYGVFIETKDFFSIGQEITMRFSLPTHPKSFELNGEIVWSGTQGFGVKFVYLTQYQLQVIQSFSEKMEEVYEIVS